MWLLPGTPFSGSNRKVARPPPPLIRFTAFWQPPRRWSPFTLLAPTLLSPQTEVKGTLAKNLPTSSCVSVSQPPSMLTSARTLSGRRRTTSSPYTPDCEWTMTTAGPTLSRSAASESTVLVPPPSSVVSVLGTSCATYWSSASSGNCRLGNGFGYSGPNRKFDHARSSVPMNRVGSDLGSAPPSRTALIGVGLKPERPRPEWSTT